MAERTTPAVTPELSSSPTGEEEALARLFATERWRGLRLGLRFDGRSVGYVPTATSARLRGEGEADAGATP